MAGSANMSNVSQHIDPPSYNGWSMVSSTEAQRPLEGAELAVNYSEYFNQGDVGVASVCPLSSLSLDSTATDMSRPLLFGFAFSAS